MIYLKINDIPVLSKFTSVTEMLNKRLDVFELRKGKCSMLTALNKRGFIKSVFDFFPD
jgi:hypothetical protein